MGLAKRRKRKVTRLAFKVPSALLLLLLLLMSFPISPAAMKAAFRAAVVSLSLPATAAAAAAAGSRLLLLLACSQPADKPEKGKSAQTESPTTRPTQGREREGRSTTPHR